MFYVLNFSSLTPLNNTVLWDVSYVHSMAKSKPNLHMKVNYCLFILPMVWTLESFYVGIHSLVHWSIHFGSCYTFLWPRLHFSSLVQFSREGIHVPWERTLDGDRQVLDQSLCSILGVRRMNLDWSNLDSKAVTLWRTFPTSSLVSSFEE